MVSVSFNLKKLFQPSNSVHDKIYTGAGAGPGMEERTGVQGKTTFYMWLLTTKPLFSRGNSFRAQCCASSFRHNCRDTIHKKERETRPMKQHVSFKFHILNVSEICNFPFLITVLSISMNFMNSKDNS